MIQSKKTKTKNSSENCWKDRVRVHAGIKWGAKIKKKKKEEVFPLQVEPLSLSLEKSQFRLEMSGKLKPFLIVCLKANVHWLFNSLSYWVARKGPGAARGQYESTCADWLREGKSPTLRVFPRPRSKLPSVAELELSLHCQDQNKSCFALSWRCVSLVLKAWIIRMDNFSPLLTVTMFHWDMEIWSHCFLCPRTESDLGVFSATGRKWSLADENRVRGQARALWLSESIFVPFKACKLSKICLKFKATSCE